MIGRVRRPNPWATKTLEAHRGRSPRRKTAEGKRRGRTVGQMLAVASTRGDKDWERYLICLTKGS